MNTNLTFIQFLQLSESELRHLTPPKSALKNKPELIDKENPNSRDSYQYRRKWHGALGTKAGAEHHEVKRDVDNNKKRLDKAKASSDTFKPLTNYLTARPPRG